MTAAPLHRCRVIGSPWPGIYAVETESGRHYGRHWHADYVLGVLDAGAQQSASGRGMVEALPGDLLAANPGEVHDGRPHGGPVRRWRSLYFPREALGEFGGDIAITKPVIKDARLRNQLLTLLAVIPAEAGIQGVRSAPNALGPRLRGDDEVLASEEALVSTFALLVDKHSTQANPQHEVPAPITRVRDYLADNLLTTPTLTQLATLTGASRYQVLRRFQRAYGLPPHAWLQQQRAERARALILQGRTLAEAAAESGFADQSHMTRVFVQRYGFTPGAWRLQ